MFHITLHKSGLHKSEFPFIQFNSFISRAGKMTKVCFEMYNRKIKTTPSTYFCRSSQVHHLLSVGCKICFHNFFQVCTSWQKFMYSRIYLSREVAVLQMKSLLLPLFLPSSLPLNSLVICCIYESCVI